jgi:hypothetical protein
MRSASRGQSLTRQATSPVVAQFQIAMKVGLVQIKQPHAFLTELLEKVLKVCHEGSPFRLMGLFEDFLALLPTQLVDFQIATQCTAPDFSPQHLPAPARDLLEGPAMARQAMLNRLDVKFMFSS